jgi:hypothetical protein
MSDTIAWIQRIKLPQLVIGDAVLALVNAALAASGMTPLREYRHTDDPFIRRRTTATAWCGRQAERSGMADRPWRHVGVARQGWMG